MNLEQFQFSEDELDGVGEDANPYLAEPREALQLLVRLASGGVGPSPGMAALEALVARRLPALARGIGVPVAPEVMEALHAAVADIGATLSFPDLANKTVIGVGGAFSAGKSRFLNSLTGTGLLPEDLGPCTVIPTYLGQGPAQAQALTAFGRSVPMDTDALAALSHAFARQHLGQAPHCLADLVRLLMVHSPAMPWPHLVFLDTPGYNPPGRQGEQGDSEAARRQLSLADHLVWLVNARNGGLRADDIDFLRALGHRQPVFFVLTQSDLVAPSALGPLLATLRQTVERHGIDCAGIMAWSAQDQSAGRHCAGDAIRDWLDRLGEQVRYPGLRRRCTLLAERYLLQCRRARDRNHALLHSLNQLRVLAGQTAVGRHDELDAEMQRLRSAQARHEDVWPQLTAWQQELLGAISALLGPCIADQAPDSRDALVLECQRTEASADLQPGRDWPLRLVATKADLKHVVLGFLDADIALKLPFSRIRQVWGVDPQALGADSELSARLLDGDQERLRFSIHYHVQDDKP